MTVGVSTTAANEMLDALGDVYVQMHTGDPGGDGTSNIALTDTRAAADLGPAGLGIRTLVAPVEWPVAWSGGQQTVSHVSAWTAETGGDFLFSAALATHAVFSNGAIPHLNLLSVSIPSQASD